MLMKKKTQTILFQLIIACLWLNLNQAFTFYNHPKTLGTEGNLDQLGEGMRQSDGRKIRRKTSNLFQSLDNTKYSIIVESEEERLRLDQEARDGMSEHMKKLELAELNGETLQDRAAWKWKIRKRIWDKLESEDLADFPRPVHHRIPNFKGAQQANEQIASLPEFRSAQCVKVNPDTPQKHIRFLTLAQNKTLLVPQPRLRTGFFSKLTQSTIPKNKLKYACTQAGVKEFGQPIGFDEPLPKVEMIIIGSCAVDPSNGARLGKGEGFAELEYGILRMMGVVDENTVVVTSVRDEQLVDDIDVTKMLRHDVPVDIICTPTQIIRTNASIPKPTGIYWDLLSPEKLSQIKVLQHLKRKIEEETGEKLPEGASEILPPTAKRGQKQQQRTRKSRMTNEEEKRQDFADQPKTKKEYDLFISNLLFGITAEELKNHIETQANVKEVKLLRGRSKGCALVKLEDTLLVHQCIQTLSGSDLLGRQFLVREFR